MLRSPRLLAGLAVVSVLLLSLNVVWLTLDRDVTVPSRGGNLSSVWATLRAVANGSGASAPAPCLKHGQTSPPTSPAAAAAAAAGVGSVGSLLHVPANTLMLGRPRSTTGFLTIGIASVFRKERYLYRTLRSLVDCSTVAERANVTVVILLADTNDTVRATRLSQLSSQFRSLVDDGFLQFIQPPPELYPDLNFTGTRRRRTFNDKPERVAWRTKQVIDFSFLFSYCHKMSEFYMVLEDDILSTSRYITAVRDFIHMHRNHDWVGLKFTQYMIIGDLVRSSSLPRLVQLMTMFREEQPVDFIMSHFVSLMVNPPGVSTRRVPSLFNHIGRRSTLVNKTQKVVDYHVNLVPRRYQHDNPPAEVLTNMRIISNHLPAYAYSVAPGMFLGRVGRGTVGTLDVALTRRRRLTRVAVVTGHKKQNLVRSGRLLAATELLRVTGSAAECADWSLLGEFGPSGVLDVRAVDKLVPGGVQCVRIEVGRNQTGNLAVAEIALFEER